MTAIVLNGTPVETADHTVLDLVSAVTGHATADLERGALAVAVARNSFVIARGAWPSTPLVDGDEIELVTALQGG